MKDDTLLQQEANRYCAQHLWVCGEHMKEILKIGAAAEG